MTDKTVAYAQSTEQVLTPQHIEALRKILQKEHARLAELVEVEGSRNQADWNPDRGELAAAASRRDRRLALRELNEEKLEQVEVALARMDAGTYGVCLSCGQPINPERLEIVPYAELCMACQAKEN